LYRLYKVVDHSKKLLPNKLIFIIHGLLLVIYLLSFSAAQYCWYTAVRAIWKLEVTFDDFERYVTYYGFYYLLQCLSNLMQVLTFSLVIKLMLPITKSERERQSKFQRFLFNGFANKEELEAAIFANNPDMTEEERSDVKRDLKDLDELIEGRSSGSSIVSGMVDVVEISNYAYMGRWRFDVERLFVHSVNEADILNNEVVTEETRESILSNQD
jgi:hypothetical protein